MNLLRAQLAGLCLVFAALTRCAAPAAAQEQPAAQDDAVAKRAAEFLQAVVAEMRVSGEQGDLEKLRPRTSPILRYNDPARVYPAAGVWRLGETGRPPLLVSLEYWLRAETDEPRIMFEFVSFTDQRLELKADEQTTWRGDGGTAIFARIDGAPKPAANDKQRLVQMRSLARRFSASEKHMGDHSDLRLLPQPLDRYTDPAHKVDDAAIFVFAYGTNPELAMLLEAAEGGWHYAVMRMSWAELVVKLDDREIARFEQLGTFPIKGAYQTAGHVTKSLTPDP
jgi:hypothetical protein